MYTGVDAIRFGVEDVDTCTRFLGDWGLRQRAERLFTTLDGGEVHLSGIDEAGLPSAFEPGSTLREVVWGLEDEAALEAIRERIRANANYMEHGDTPSVVDPDGLYLSFRVSQRVDVSTPTVAMNTMGNPVARVDERAPVYERAEPVRIGHVVLFCADVMASVEFYTKTLGFLVSDYYPEAGYFLRCRETAPHHQLFLLQHPKGASGLNHVAFSVRDIHEVFGGGLNISRQGWSTQLGPGRHPISSAYFWYVNSPTGGLFEYFADEDWCTVDWPAKAWERTPEHFAEWAIAGGLDGQSRRQLKPL